MKTIEDTIIEEQARQLHREQAQSTITGILAAIMVVNLFGKGVSTLYSGIFIAILVFLGFYNYFIRVKFYDVTTTMKETVRPLHLYTIGYFMTSVVWTTAVYVFFPEAHYPQRLALFSAVLVSGTASVFTLGAYFPAFVAAVLPMGLISVLILGIKGPLVDPIFVSLAFFVPLILAIAWRFNQLVLKTLRLGFENSALVVQLTEQKNVAESATVAKSNFLAAASHDLRQPMHALNLYLGVLSDYALPEPARPILSNVKQCAQAMDEMFRELLDISRLDAHMVVAEMQAFPLAMLLGQIQMEFAPQAKAKGLSLHVVPCSLWVRSDPALLERILRNFVSNAVRYTSQGKILIGCRRRESGVSLMVCDTGQGIAPEQQKKIFDEFYQVDNPERDRSQGLGLGLATVQRLANLLKARLSLTSTFGRGAVFAIDLPIASAGDAILLSRPTSSVPIVVETAGALIVVIDDERLILNATKTLLEHWGYSVVAATSGEDAMLQLGDSLRVPDAIICDNRLRDNDIGTDVIANLRNEFNQDIPAVLITGDTSRERLLVIEASGIPVLFKPLQENILREMLNRLIATVHSE